MNVSIGVEHFGKIEKAEITLGRLILLVGENNSGKTYMMQLLYGVTSVIIRHSRLTMRIYEEDDERYLIDSESIGEWENSINEYLEQNKEQIVRDIFYRDIPIGRLYMRIRDVDLSYVIRIKQREFVREDADDTILTKALGYEVSVSRKKSGKENAFSRMVFGRSLDRDFVDKHVEETVAADILGMRTPGSALFFPASRTGMLLLYKYFFAEKDTKLFLVDDVEIGNEAKNQLGLSAPVYNFLQFLLRFTPNHLQREKEQKLLDFIQRHLIDGKLELSSDESFYIPEGSEQRIPLYLSSSLINELAPIVKMLSGIYRYDTVYYDEIETSLHPLKQKAMARLMIRLVNSGIRMIISTHSDSMAGNMNNLLTFTMGNWSAELKEKKMRDLSLEEADILQTKDVHVYQFVNTDHGTSNVSELEFRTVNNLGYDFELFNQNLRNLSDDTIKIME